MKKVFELTVKTIDNDAYIFFTLKCKKCNKNVSIGYGSDNTHNHLILQGAFHQCHTVETTFSDEDWVEFINV